MAVVLLLLNGCVAQRPRPALPSDEALARQAQREHVLRALPGWRAAGRFAVADDNASGSGSFEWVQEGAAFRFRLHAPISGKTWQLSGDAQGVRLQGLRQETLEASDAETLLHAELGWELPFAALGDWLRAARAPGPSQIEFRADGLPARIEQQGWSVRFPDYDFASVPPLPRKVFARQGARSVRLAISAWTLASGSPLPAQAH